MKDLSPVEAGRWMDTVPEMVQEAVTSDATQYTIEQLGKKYSLHVDVEGLLYKLTGYMLIGYVTPEVFSHELQTAGVQSSVAQRILTDINNEIFIPLRNRLRNASSSVSIRQAVPVPPPPKTPPRIPPPSYGAVAPVAWPAQPVATPRPVMRAPVPQPMPPPQQVVRPAPPPPVAQTPQQPPVAPPAKPSSPAWQPPPEKIDELPKGFYAPPPQSPRYPGQEDVSQYLKKVSRPAPAQPINRLAVPTPQPATQARPSVPQSSQVADSARLLEDHEEPHINVSGDSQRPQGGSVATPPSLQENSPAQLWQSQPVRPRPSVSPSPIMQYPSDPYRESVDEEEQ